MTLSNQDSGGKVIRKAPLRIDASQIRSSIEQFWEDADLPAGWSLVHQRSRRRGALLRLPGEDGRSCIVKTWIGRGWRDRVKLLGRFSNGRREWRAHRRLYAKGLAVPQPLAYSSWIHQRRGFEFFAIEDLGRTTKVLACLKASVGEGNEAEVNRIERALIDLTSRFIAAGVTDVDHQLNNVVLTDDGRIFRLDVECARRWPFNRVPMQALGGMIGALVASHAFACQPALDRTERFAIQLAKATTVPAEALRVARMVIDRRLERQRQFNGIDSRLSISW